MKSVLKITVLGLMALVILSGCGRQLQKNGRTTVNGDKADVFSYQFEMGNCSTGRHTFTKHADFCAALRDDSLNFNCAGELRENDFRISKCEGAF